VPDDGGSADRERSDVPETSEGGPVAKGSDADVEPADDESAEVALPDIVRRRLLDVVASRLDAVPTGDLPPRLRVVAGFTPPRRVKVAGDELAKALESTQFRDLLLQHLDPDRDAVVAALTDGEPPTDADPVEVAALAFLARRRGWRELVQSAAGDEDERDGTTRLRESIERLQRRLEQQKLDARRDAKAARAQRDELERQVAVLRTAVRETESERDTARAERDAAQEEALASRQALERERAEHSRALDRSRRRAADLAREVSDLRRQREAGQELTTARTRVLLATLVEAANGLRREWGVASESNTPADFFVGGPAVTGAASSALDDPNDLREALRAPQAHMIVDGYNVTLAEWTGSTLLEQRARLTTALGSLAAQTGAEITVVFDGRSGIAATPPRAKGVRVLFGDEDESADDLIRRLISLEPEGRPVVVVSSDGEVAAAARRPGHRSARSEALLRLIAGRS
jgi:hypothetical protein